MRTYEITYLSASSLHYPKPTTAVVVEPDEMTSDTGVMLATHGWGGNRFQYLDLMEYAAPTLNVIAVGVEYRGSGYDFDPVKGRGYQMPYDASFFQVTDVLNGLRTVLDLRPGLNRSRLFHYGGSQGGHIALLSAVHAPNTFAFVFAASPVCHLDLPWEHDFVGRTFQPHELLARNVIAQAARIRCPVLLEHGTQDETVPHDTHTEVLAAEMRRLGKQVTLNLYEGGTHSLAPVTTRLETFKKTGVEPLRTLRNSQTDDFAAGRVIEVPCGERAFRVDWSKPAADPGLIAWIR